MDRLTVGLLATFVALLLGSGLLAYVLRDRNAPAPADVSVPHEKGDKGANAVATPPPAENRPLLWQLFGGDASASSPTTVASWESIAARIALRFSLAAFLAALLAFRPRRGVSMNRRNPYVAQTQILMAVAVGAMMMVVGDSAARAFGIFAAASLVRFRTNIRDPKEITVLLICLGVGLAAGVGRWDMAVILTLFVLLALAILEYFEQSQVFRSMEVTVKTRKVDRTNQVLQQVFSKNNLDTEMRELDREDEDDLMGKIVYIVNLSTGLSTNQLSEQIFATDAENVDTIEWQQKESSTYIYR
jgi:uncharacterized membrane protein YhiD involved in acid resistance